MGVGRGSLTEAWDVAKAEANNGAATNGSKAATAGEKQADGYSAALVPHPNIISYAHGAEMLPDSDSSRCALLYVCFRNGWIEGSVGWWLTMLKLL